MSAAHIDSSVEDIGMILIDENRPLKERFRALFTLKNLGGQTAINCISRCFDDSSALLKHECAYCLGQMQDTEAIPFLRKVLEDKQEDAMVRHEAGGSKVQSQMQVKYSELPTKWPHKKRALGQNGHGLNEYLDGYKIYFPFLSIKKLISWQIDFYGYGPYSFLHADVTTPSLAFWRVEA